jgi:lipopolysaccharide biosynthesis glycosyltransferase
MDRRMIALTIYDDAYEVGARVLERSFRRYNPDIEFEAIHADRIECDLPASDRYSVAMKKISLFKHGWKGHKQMLFIDADCLCLGSVKWPGFAMGKDSLRYQYPLLNTGVVFYENCSFTGVPFQTFSTYDGGDQGYINDAIYYGWIKPGILGPEMNFLASWVERHKNLHAFLQNKIKIFHFVGPKPWIEPDKCSPLWLERWMRFYGTI